MLAPYPRADGVQYRILAPYGLTVFDCQSLRATLQPHHCAANWTARKDGSKCIACPIGAIHSGKPPATIQPLPPNSRQPCCRCGQMPTFRLIGGIFCPGCYNRTREVLKGFNSKGKPPWQTGEKLREAWAIVAVPDAESALDILFAKKPKSGDTGFSHGLKIAHAPGLPLFCVIYPQHLWIDAIVTGADELQRIVDRLLPGAEIADSEFSATFAERWRFSAEPSTYTTQAKPQGHPCRNKLTLSVNSKLKHPIETPCFS
jgi:hypothetical protein